MSDDFSQQIIPSDEPVYSESSMTQQALQPRHHYVVYGIILLGAILLIIGGFFWYTTKRDSATDVEYIPVVDSDGDLLSDTEERDHGTDVSKIDTDDDGIDDWTEVAQGFDPKNPRSINPDMLDGDAQMARLRAEFDRLRAGTSSTPNQAQQ